MGTLSMILLPVTLILTRLFVSSADDVDVSTLPIAIHPERAQLLKDALGWMTLRKSGNLMTDAEVQALFLEPLLHKYTTSKFYRTFVIAFQHAVLPRMTLTQGDACDFDYTKKYKSPHNNSVTWYYQKQFTFKNYNKRLGPYCDYRQGLICEASSQKCGCPEDSTMQAIEPGSSVKRCLLQENKVCNLIDIDHGRDPRHVTLAGKLHQVIFNLEKPLSCQPGTQCRFKSGNPQTPLCYSATSGPFESSRVIRFGTECALGLDISPSNCELNERPNQIGTLPGFVCYNYGPPRSIKDVDAVNENKIGFCAHEYGPYALVNSWGSGDGLKSIEIFFMSNVHPRTVPLRGPELKAFLKKYIDGAWRPLTTKSNFGKAGEVCSVANTKKLEEAWAYFFRLDKDPPPGQDFVPEATKPELESKLQDVIDVIWDKADYCKIFYVYYKKHVYDPSYQCVANGSSDADGNDGQCQEPGTLETETFAEHFIQFKLDMADSENEEKKEEKIYNKEILQDYPEPPCDPMLGPLPSLTGRHHGPDTLEGGYCPENSVCYQDFSDASGIYEGSYYCGIASWKTQQLICHDTKQKLEKCEQLQLEKKVNKALEHLDDYAALQEGDRCHYDFEKAVREKDEQALERINQYQILNWLERGILCERKARLECTLGGTCECLEGLCELPTTTTSTPSPTEAPEVGGTGGTGEIGTGTGDGNKEPRPLEPPMPYSAVETTQVTRGLVLSAIAIGLLL